MRDTYKRELIIEKRDLYKGGDREKEGQRHRERKLDNESQKKK